MQSLELGVILNRKKVTQHSEFLTPHSDFVFLISYFSTGSAATKEAAYRRVNLQALASIQISLRYAAQNSLSQRFGNPECGV